MRGYLRSPARRELRADLSDLCEISTARACTRELPPTSLGGCVGGHACAVFVQSRKTVPALLLVCALFLRVVCVFRISVPPRRRRLRSFIMTLHATSVFSPSAPRPPKTTQHFVFRPQKNFVLGGAGGSGGGRPPEDNIIMNLFWNCPNGTSQASADCRQVTG